MSDGNYVVVNELPSMTIRKAMRIGDSEHLIVEVSTQAESSQKALSNIKTLWHMANSEKENKGWFK